MASVLKTLFYLPVVTPWWFDNIVAHLIRSLAVHTEVHILAPVLWRNTGIGPAQLEGLGEISSVHWHIADGEDHMSLRTSPEDPDGLTAFVHSIAPDYVFCRSADIATPAQFPGKVVHMVEAGVPPFTNPPRWIILQRAFWHHGAMPVLAEEERCSIDKAFVGIWERTRKRFDEEAPFSQPRSTALQAMGLPIDRTIIALPLEYEHEESFTAFHNRFESNLDLIHHVADALDDRHVLAITDHPLNSLHVDNRAVHAAIEALGPRARLLPRSDGRYSQTDLLIKNCDGLIVQNTKAIYSGAFFGKPTLRLSHRPTGAWIGVDEDMPSFLGHVASGEPGACPEQARLWSGFHILHEVIDPLAISGAEILERIEQPFARDRLEAGRVRFEAYQCALDAAS